MEPAPTMSLLRAFLARCLMRAKAGMPIAEAFTRELESLPEGSLRDGARASLLVVGRLKGKGQPGRRGFPFTVEAALTVQTDALAIEVALPTALQLLDENLDYYEALRGPDRGQAAPGFARFFAGAFYRLATAGYPFEFALAAIKGDAASQEQSYLVRALREDGPQEAERGRGIFSDALVEALLQMARDGDANAVLAVAKSEAGIA